MDYTKIQRNINLDELSSSGIFVLENFDSIKHLAYKFIDCSDPEGALEFAKKLEAKLRDVEPRTQKEEYYVRIYFFWVFRLKLFALFIMPKQERVEIIKEHIFEILYDDLDIRKAILRCINIFSTNIIIVEEVQIYLSALTGSLNILGSDFQTFQKQNFKPTISNWVKEYQSVFKLMGGMKLEPSSFHIVKFMDTNPYIKYLNEPEKQILRDLLDLYNWLLSPTVYIEAKIPTEQVIKTSQEVPYMATQNGRLDEVQKPEAKEEQVNKVEQKFEAKPVIPITPAPVEKPIVPAAPSKEIKEEVLPGPRPESIPTSTPTPPVQPIEIEIEVPPGISFGPAVQSPSPQSPTTPAFGDPSSGRKGIDTVKSEIEEKKKQIEGEIDKKIEDLKKKTH